MERSPGLVCFTVGGKYWIQLSKKRIQIALTLEVLVSELCDPELIRNAQSHVRTIELTFAVDGLSTSAVARRKELHVGHAFNESGEQ